MRHAHRRTVVGFFGYDYNRRIALQALAVSAAKSDVHSIFAGYAVRPLHITDLRHITEYEPATDSL